MIIKANHEFLFGYFISADFLKEDRYETVKDAFIFSLVNPNFKGPIVFPVKKEKGLIALY